MERFSKTGQMFGESYVEGIQRLMCLGVSRRKAEKMIRSREKEVERTVRADPEWNWTEVLAENYENWLEKLEGNVEEE